MKSLINQRAGRSGMALLEVIMAMTLFTLVSFSLVLALHAAMTAENERNQIDAVNLGLENQMSLLHSSRLIPQEKDLPPDSSGILYTVQVQLEQMQDQKKQAVPNIYRVTITGKWKFEGKAEDRSLTELVYQP